MKYIFYTLLVGNIAYFTYSRYWLELNELIYPSISMQEAASETTAIEKSREKKLTLLQEREINSVKETHRVVESPEIDPVIEPEVEVEDILAPICKAIGPFVDMKLGQDMIAQLATLNLHVILQAIDKAYGESDYRLMVSPAGSLKDAYKRHRDLKSNNIESFVITKGPLKAGISLGIFSTKAAAENARANIPDLGFSLELVETPRIGKEYWVIPSKGPALIVSDSLWDSLADEHPDLRHQLMGCID